jgi:hypothetical protein
MRLLVHVLIILCFSNQPVHAQATYPNLPEQDYAIYTAIINEFPNCNNTIHAYRQNKLLFIRSTTEAQNSSGFRFDFAKVAYSPDTTKAICYFWRSGDMAGK